ncbi:LysR family transcriptional regulator [Polaromonas sp. P1(28)-8]|nr:LysR family transcriptional regulator [Polaromonas sp. P1(28)-8]
MKFSALETLQSVVTTGSFVGAANEVGLTPSAVSLQMKQLEEYFGRPLFDRSGRTAIPTPLARELALAMNQALGVIEGFRTSKSYAVSGTIRLGAVPSVQTAVLPSTLRIAQERHPALNIRLTLDVSARCKQRSALEALMPPLSCAPRPVDQAGFIGST